MFPLTREILLYALGILMALMAVLVVLIFRKRVPLNMPAALSKKKVEESPASLIEEPSEGGAYTKTGPDDADSIKEKIIAEKKVQTHPETEQVIEKTEPTPAGAPPEPQMQPPAQVQEMPPAPPAPYTPPAAVPKPPPEPTPEEEAREPVFQEGVIEQGMELHDHPEELEQEEEGKYGPPHNEPQPEALPPQKDIQPQQAPVQQPATPGPSAQEGEYVMLDELEEESDKHIAEQAAPKVVKEKELVAKGIVKPQEEKGVVARFVPRTQPEYVKALKPRPSSEKPSEFSFKKVENIETGTPVDSATIAKDPKSFIGQTVAIEGDLQLSSKGKDDVWYILFNKTGSSVVMSREEIPVKRCRLFAKVEKTRMGQIYLNVTRYEEI